MDMSIKEYRTREGMSLFDFAVLVGLTPGGVSKIEHGGGCTSATAKRIIDATAGEVTLDDLQPVPRGQQDDEAAGA